MLLNLFRLYLLFGLGIQIANAQSNEYNFKFKTFTTSQGLTDNVVVKTVKDKYGFLWIATHNGISRFDGLRFKNYSHNPNDSNSLRSIWVTDLLIDNQQTLWASTEWGVCYYDPINDHFKYINEKDKMQVLYKAPMCLDAAGFIWIAMEDGLKKINTVSKKYTNTPLLRIPDPKFIVTDNKGSIFIGTRANGIIKYNSSNNLFYPLNLSTLPKGTQYEDAIVDDSTLWIATDVGLLQLNKNETYALFSKGTEDVKEKKITQLTCVKLFKPAFGNNKLVCGAYNKKLYLFDKIKKVFVYQWESSFSNTEMFPAALVYNLYADNKILWIATDRGLSQINLENQQSKSFQIKEMLDNNSIAFLKKVVPTTNKYLVCAIPWQPYNGIVLYDLLQKKIIKKYNTGAGKTGKKYLDAIVTKNNEIIAARDGAVDFFSESLQLTKTIRINHKTTCIYENKDNNLWLGIENGILFIDKTNNKVSAYKPNFIGTDVERNSFAGEFPVAGLAEAGSKLWLTCIKYGLFSFDLITKKFQAHRQLFNSAYSTVNRCNSVEVVGTDSIWYGNMDGITCYVASQNKFINYNISNGLKSSYVYSLVKDSSNNFWCRGNADVFYFKPKTGAVISYEMQPSYNVFFFEQRLSVSKNSVFVGHEGGFTKFENGNIVTDVKEIPSVEFVAVKIANKNLAFNRDSCAINPTILNANQNQVSFEFAAIAYNNADEIVYEYFLDELDKTWTKAGNKTNTGYNNLAPGEYFFNVKAINKLYKTDSKIAVFYFVIKPAFYQQWWFWPLLVLLFITVVVYLARKRVQSIRQKEKQKTAVNKTMAELEIKMLRSQMNPHFIFNSLNSIQKYIWENKEEDAAEYLARFAKLMRAILENSLKETVTLAEEIETTKLYVELEHRRSNAGFDYSIKIDEKLQQEKVLIPPLIMQPFIENAIWHGLNKKRAKGILSINVIKKDDQLICVIDDDGVGRNKIKEINLLEKKSLGISITQQRIEKLFLNMGQKASVTIYDKVENGLNAGTTVTIILPLQILAHA